VEGKAVVAGNAWKGGQRAYFRSIAKEANELLRQQRKLHECLAETGEHGL
jgi:hypothetical protein